MRTDLEVTPVHRSLLAPVLIFGIEREAVAPVLAPRRGSAVCLPTEPRDADARDSPPRLRPSGATPGEPARPLGVSNPPPPLQDGGLLPAAGTPWLPPATGTDLLMLARDARTHEPGLLDLLSWDMLVADGLLRNVDGALAATWEYRGPDLDSATADELLSSSRALARVLDLLGDGWMVHAEALRLAAPPYPAVDSFPDPVTRAIDEARRETYASERARYATPLLPDLDARSASCEPGPADLPTLRRGRDPRTSRRAAHRGVRGTSRRDRAPACEPLADPKARHPRPGALPPYDPDRSRPASPDLAPRDHPGVPLRSRRAPRWHRARALRPAHRPRLDHQPPGWLESGEPRVPRRARPAVPSCLPIPHPGSLHRQGGHHLDPPQVVDRRSLLQGLHGLRDGRPRINAQVHRPPRTAHGRRRGRGGRRARPAGDLRRLPDLDDPDLRPGSCPSRQERPGDRQAAPERGDRGDDRDLQRRRGLSRVTAGPRLLQLPASPRLAPRVFRPGADHRRVVRPARKPPSRPGRPGTVHRRRNRRRHTLLLEPCVRGRPAHPRRGSHRRRQVDARQPLDRPVPALPRRPGLLDRQGVEPVHPLPRVRRQPLCALAGPGRRRPLRAGGPRRRSGRAIAGGRLARGPPAAPGGRDRAAAALRHPPGLGASRPLEAPYALRLRRQGPGHPPARRPGALRGRRSASPTSSVPSAHRSARATSTSSRWKRSSGCARRP